MKIMRDASGHDVPLKYVSEYDRKRDAAIRKIHARWMKTRKAIEDCMKESLKELTELVKMRPDEIAEKGNFEIRSFDGLLSASVRQSYNIKFDERVREARDAMLEYAKSLCMKAGTDGRALFEIVEEAFKVSATGQLSIVRVLGLCRRNINAPEWVQARETLLDAIQPEKGRCYLRVAKRKSTQDVFQIIRLDSTDCWPEAEA